MYIGGLKFVTLGMDRVVPWYMASAQVPSRDRKATVVKCK